MTSETFTFIDLFAGIGGLRQAFESRGVDGKCVFTSEWDKFAEKTYLANVRREFHTVEGDIRKLEERGVEVPDHDVLVAGFPCQPFSLAGVSKKNSLGRSHGFLDETQGTLFFEIEKIILEKIKKDAAPSVVFLENVPHLLSHDKGKTFATISEHLDALGYRIVHEIVSARPWVPQGRRRIIIIGFRKEYEARSKSKVSQNFSFEKINRYRRPPKGFSNPPSMAWVLHDSSRQRDRSLSPSVLPSRNPENAWYTDSDGRVNPKYTISPALWSYLKEYAAKHRAAGNGFGFGLVGPEDVARTLSARYYKDGAEILVRQDRKPPRRLTPRECARLMGFPDTFKIPVSDNQAYKQFGNSVVVPMMAAIARELKPAIIDLSAVHH